MEQITLRGTAPLFVTIRTFPIWQTHMFRPCTICWTNARQRFQPWHGPWIFGV